MTDDTNENAPDLSGARPITADEYEALMLKDLESCEERWQQIVGGLVQLYVRTRRYEQAIPHVLRLQDAISNPEDKARWALNHGILFEDMRAYESAAVVYRRALAYEPASTEVWYFLNNNLGYSLNQLGRHGEAETYCRTAVKVDPERHNAHKNLGIALDGQGRYVDAALSLVEAVCRCPRDPRALRSLEELTAQHRSELSVISNFDELLDQCRAAVKRAQTDPER